MKRILSILLSAIVLIVFVAGIFALWSLHRGKSNSGDPASAGQQEAKDADGNAVSASTAAASGKKDEKEPDNAPIVSVALYKNGFCFVNREIAPRDWSEPLTLTRSIAPRHGTLWFTPAETVLRRTSRERTVTQDPAPTPKKNDAPGYRPDWSSMTDVFEWQEVTIRLKEGGTVSGRVVGNQKPLPPEPPKENDPSELLIMDELSSFRSAASSSSRNFSSSSYSPSVPVKSSFGAAFLTLQTADGSFVAVRQSDVVEIDAKSLYEGPAPVTPAPRTTKVVEDVQIVEAPKGHSGPVQIHYLTEGITWSPFYNLILSDKPGTAPDADGVLTINAAATVMNNYSDFENAEIELISGFPSLDFASVVGAVAKKLPLTTFLSSLANPKSGTPNYLQNSGVMGQGGVMSQSILSNSARPVREIFKEDDLDEMPSAPSKWSASGLEDIQYKSVGKLSMKKGDAVYLPIATQTAPFEYVTTWSAPMAEPYSYGFKTSDTNVWSTVRFRNPFDFALTTAPYEIFRDGKVLGQSTGAWFGAGETVSVKFTRAMAVSCSMSYSETGNRDRVFTVSRPNASDLRYRHPDVTAELTLTNISDKPVKMVIDSVFYGELLNAEENPAKVKQMSERSLNNKYKLVWTLTLPANTKKTISYTYSTVKEQ